MPHLAVAIMFVMLIHGVFVVAQKYRAGRYLRNCPGDQLVGSLDWWVAFAFSKVSVLAAGARVRRGRGLVGEGLGMSGLLARQAFGCRR